jgi:phage baseplate assembly protein W
MIDKPAETVAPEVMQEAEWLIETYEPRVTVNDILIRQEDGTDGGYAVTADVTEI